MSDSKKKGDFVRFNDAWNHGEVLAVGSIFLIAIDSRENRWRIDTTKQGWPAEKIAVSHDDQPLTPLY